MTSFWWALAMATVLLGLGDRCNRRWFGFLPDDPPRPGRKQHAAPVALGGVLLLPAVVFWLVHERATLPGWPFAVAAVAIAGAVGFLDDRGKEHGTDLDWKTKAIGLLAAALLVATATSDARCDTWRWLGFGLLTFVLINAVNFLDNTDGVAAVVVAAPLLAAGGSDGWTLAIAATALAFVPWNWPRPRLFLGDAGAYALGAALALFVLGRIPAGLGALWACALPLADFTQVVCARLWLGHPPWVGDRRHLTHIAMNVGLPRILVAPLFAVAAFALGQLA